MSHYLKIYHHALFADSVQGHRLERLHHRRHLGIVINSTGSAAEDSNEANIQIATSTQPNIDVDDIDIEDSSTKHSGNNNTSSNDNNGASTVPAASPSQPPLPSKLPAAPWDISTTIVVMACWLICFYIAAYDIVPFMLRTLGYGGAAAAQPGSAAAAQP